MRATQTTILALCLTLSCGTVAVAAPQQARRPIRVLRVEEGAVVLDAGTDAGLQVGQEFSVKHKVSSATPSGDGTVTFPRAVARCRVVAVEAASAVCQIFSLRGEIFAGDAATQNNAQPKLPLAPSAKGANSQAADSAAEKSLVRLFSEPAQVAQPLPLQAAAQTQSLESPTSLATQSPQRASQAPATVAELRTQFRVKYVAEGAVYLDGGRAAGLEEGQKLEMRRQREREPNGSPVATPPADVLAQLVVVSVAEASAVCEVRSAQDPLHEGDVVTLSAEDAAALIEKRAASGQRRYLQVLTFSEGDPLDEEVRDAVPKPPSPAVNRARGRIGFDYSGVRSRTGGSASSAEVGVVLRADVTRIGGTFWNFSGYWRGRLSARSGGSQQQTLRDLINRTYHLSSDYVNPNSRWVAGFGRMYVPWANSLNTIDGGYLGRRFGRNAVAGLFAGTTPDPTSWNYNPNRRMAGVFVNFEGGNFQTFRYSTTFGGGVSLLRWKMERPFGFLENSFFFGRKVSLYNSLEIDQPRLVAAGTHSTPGVARSFVTLRLQLHTRIAVDLNHNYFRDFPTFDPQLIGTGLLDKLLFQGFSGGLRADLPGRISAYFNAGRSSRTGDARSSWNQLYSLTFHQIPRLHLRADLRYSKFDSSLGRGQYRSLSFSREIGEGFRWEVTGGEQRFTSAVTQQSRSRFLTAQIDWFLSRHYFLGSGFTIQRGFQNDYEQWFFNFGYRF